MIGVKEPEDYIEGDDEFIEKEYAALDDFFFHSNCYKEHRGLYATNDKITAEECYDRLAKFAEEYPYIGANLSRCSFGEFTPLHDLTYLAHILEDVREKELEIIKELEEAGASDDEIFSRE